MMSSFRSAAPEGLDADVEGSPIPDPGGNRGFRIAPHIQAALTPEAVEAPVSKAVWINGP